MSETLPSIIGQNMPLTGLLPRDQGVLRSLEREVLKENESTDFLSLYSSVIDGKRHFLLGLQCYFGLKSG